MTTKLLALHGYTQNGATLRKHMDELVARMPPELILEFPDGPHTCSPGSVDRMYAALNGPRQPAPYCAWWDATDDGRVYRGFEQARDLIALAASAPGIDRVGLLGFSQGAIAASALTALAARQAFPRIDFVILIAGRAPRADSLAPLFATPLEIPSLHVWGERDAFAQAASSQLVQCFAPEQREVALWPGPHRVPTRGPAAESLLRFIDRHL